MNQADLIWMNGELVAWEDAKVHVLTHALHYGTGVFEGIRAYETPRGTAIFRHADHVERLFRSAGMHLMDIPYTREELRAATHETINRNGLNACYIRPLVYRGAGPMGLYPLDCPVEVAIAVWEWGAYLGDEGKRRGVRGKVSSFRRISSDSVIPAAKATGQYVNSVLAKIEADKSGYEEAILLDDRGMVCQGEAGPIPGMTGRTFLEHLDQHGVAVAVQPHLAYPLPVAARLALDPVAVSAPGKEGRSPGGQGAVQRRVIHPAHHQHLTGRLLLDDRRDQAGGVTLEQVRDLRVEVIGRGAIGSVGGAVESVTRPIVPGDDPTPLGVSGAGRVAGFPGRGHYYVRS